MKMVNPLVAAFFLAVSACSGQSVPDKDEILTALNSGDLSVAQKKLNIALHANPGDSELHFLNAWLALEVGNAELAKTELSQLAANPKYAAQARDMLAQAQLMSGKPDLALKTLGDQPYASGLAYAVAIDANWAIGKFQDATGLLAKGKAAYPDSVNLLYTDAEIALGKGDVAAAKVSSQRILALDANNLHGHLLAGQIALVERHPDEAEVHFDAALQRNPGNQAALLAKAAIAHDRGDKEKAQAFLESAARSGGVSNLYIAAFMAQMAIEAGDVERANKILQGVTGAPDLPYILMLRGVVAEARGQHEQAISNLVPFFSKGGENPAARFALCNAFAATGDKAKAWTYLKPLADALNASPQILALAAQLTGELNLPDAANYAARQQAAARPDPIAKDMGLAEQAIGAGDWKKADAIYSKLLAQPGGHSNPILLNNASSVRLMLGDANGAIALANEALALAPNDPLINDTLAWALFKRDGATPQVVSLINKAMQGQPGNPEIREHFTAIANAKR